MTDDRCVCGHDEEQHVTIFAVRSDSGLPCWLCECGRYRTSGWQDDGGKERVWDGINDRIHADDEPELSRWVMCETATGKVLDRWTETPDGRLVERGDEEPAESGRHWFGGLPDDCA